MKLKFVLLPLCVTLLAACGPRDVTKGGQEVMAFVMCQEPVQKLLRSPSSAKFPTMGQQDVLSVHSGDGIYLVDGYVDSQNGFGAMLRSNWECKIKQNPDETWSVMDLRIH